MVYTIYISKKRMFVNCLFMDDNRVQTIAVNTNYILFTYGIDTNSGAHRTLSEPQKRVLCNRMVDSARLIDGVLSLYTGSKTSSDMQADPSATRSLTMLLPRLPAPKVQPPPPPPPPQPTSPSTLPPHQHPLPTHTYTQMHANTQKAGQSTNFVLQAAQNMNAKGQGHGGGAQNMPLRGDAEGKISNGTNTPQRKEGSDGRYIGNQGIIVTVNKGSAQNHRKTHGALLCTLPTRP